MWFKDQGVRHREFEAGKSPGQTTRPRRCPPKKPLDFQRRLKTCGGAGPRSASRLRDFHTRRADFHRVP